MSNDNKRNIQVNNMNDSASLNDEHLEQVSGGAVPARRVQCENCGKMFNYNINKTCTYCGQPYKDSKIDHLG